MGHEMAVGRKRILEADHHVLAVPEPPLAYHPVMSRRQSPGLSLWSEMITQVSSLSMTTATRPIPARTAGVKILF
jgi:hypothetical protein